MVTNIPSHFGGEIQVYYSRPQIHHDPAKLNKWLEKIFPIYTVLPLSRHGNCMVIKIQIKIWLLMVINGY